MKRVLSMISGVDNIKHIANKMSILDTIKEVQESEDFNGWFLDVKGTTAFDINDIEKGKSYSVYGLKGPLTYDVEPLLFTTDGTAAISMTKSKSDANTISLEYSFDGQDWTEWDLSELNISADDTLYIRGNNPTGLSYHDNYESYFSFVMTGDNVSCSGNIMSLIDYKKPIMAIPCSKCFYSLFINCSSLVSAPELPATELTESCYYGMFGNCSSLVTAPALPATTLANSCYLNMFGRCSSLKTAPELPAKTLTLHCYGSMFRQCSSLVTAPALPATELASQCYSNMFRECTKLVSIPEILAAPSTKLLCYERMFQGCTALMTAPELPAMELGAQCYEGMFYGCTKLTNAPALPATKLASACYANMFQNCSSLVNAPALPAMTLTDNCYRGMFQNCTLLETAPDLSVKTLAFACYESMFQGCSSLNQITCLYEGNDLFDGVEYMFPFYTENWVQGVSSEGVFYVSPNKQWGNIFEESAIPSGWTVVVKN